MKKSPPWQLRLRGYRKSEIPAQRSRCQIWQAAIGLQGVDGLIPSDYFVGLAEKQIEGRLSLPALEKKLCRYYRWHKNNPALSEETWEADLVSTHIAELLTDTDFRFEPEELKRIHHHLFRNVYDFAGDFRDYDIRKNEWVLNGESVCYEDCSTIGASLEQQFAREGAFSYEGLSSGETISHLAGFISGIWLTHPYGEGNTRTTSVFLMRYLRSMGMKMKQDEFMEAWYFRNALVRANYSCPEDHVESDDQFLQYFLQNLLLGADNPLRNQELHVNYPNID